MEGKGIKQYEYDGRPFLHFLDYHELAPIFDFQWDDLLVEFKNGVDLPPGASPPTRSKFEKPIACVEKANPHFKGGLPLSRSVLNAWKVSFSPIHAVPMVPRWGLVIARGINRRGRARVAAVLTITNRYGLRPGEGFGLAGTGFVLPEESINAGNRAVLVLGVRSGTKSGRAQTVLVDDPFCIALLRVFRELLPLDELLAGLRSLTAVSSPMRQAADDEGLPPTGWTGHSARAGFATGAYLD